MNNFYKGGRGLYLPEQHVETQCIASLQRNQLNQDVPQNIVCSSCRDTVRRGVSHTPTCDDNMISTGGRKHSAPTWTLLILIFICCMFHNAAFGQSHQEGGAAAGVVTPLTVGQKVPEDFWTREHLFYINGDTVRKTLQEYKGKMLILGFWATWCSSCLRHQRDIETYTREYEDRLSFLKINSVQTKDNLERIKNTINGIIGQENRLNLENFSTIINDTYFQSILPHKSYPYYVWVNKSGIIQITTFRNLLDRNFVAPFIDYSR